MRQKDKPIPIKDKRVTTQAVGWGTIIRDTTGNRVIEVPTEEEGLEYIKDHQATLV